MDTMKFKVPNIISVEVSYGGGGRTYRSHVDIEQLPEIIELEGRHFKYVLGVIDSSSGSVENGKIVRHIHVKANYEEAVMREVLTYTDFDE